jgi:hypothetical protein
MLTMAGSAGGRRTPPERMKIHHFAPIPDKRHAPRSKALSERAHFPFFIFSEM